MNLTRPGKWANQYRVAVVGSFAIAHYTGDIAVVSTVEFEYAPGINTKKFLMIKNL